MDSMTQHRKARLRQLIEMPPFFGNQAEFARHTGLTKGRITQLLDPLASFGERSATHLALKLDLAPFYFENGYELGRLSYAPREQHAIVAGILPVPLINEVQAAQWSELVQNFKPENCVTYLLTEQPLSSVAFALTINDDSMRTEFRSGDKVIIDPGVLPAPGDFVAASCGSDPAIFRKYRPRRLDAEGMVVYELIALNEDYPVLSSDVQPLILIGTMVEQRRFRQDR